MAGLGAVLARAVRELRARVGDPLAEVALITPEAVNGVLALQALGQEGPWIRVQRWTPGQLVDAWADAAGAPPSPPARWEEVTVARRVRALAEAGALGPHGDTLTLPGWRDALLDAVRRLEAAEGAPLLDVAADAWLRERASILDTLRADLAATRRAAGYSGPVERARAAAGPRAVTPHDAARAVVVMGDARLPRAVHDALAPWLAERAVIRVEVAPLDAVPDEPHGLRAACGDAVVWRVDHAPAISALRTPDERRDGLEAVRAALDAIEDGVALPDIAIVVPTASAAAPVRDGLRRAGVPAVWLTGPPLATSPAARGARLILAVATGAATLDQLHDLLTHPSLRVHARLRDGVGPPTGGGSDGGADGGAPTAASDVAMGGGPRAPRGSEGSLGVAVRADQRAINGAHDGSVGGAGVVSAAATSGPAGWNLAHTGSAGDAVGATISDSDGLNAAHADSSPGVRRGRWRRLLETIGVRTSLTAIHAAAAHLAETAEPDDRAAAAGLARTLAALLDALPPAEVAPIGAHASRLSAFLAAWWAPGRDAAQVRMLLDGWGATPTPVPFAVFADEVCAALEATPWLEGALTDRAVRVLPPMAAFGGVFRRVVVCGVADETLPTAWREHPLLTDALLARAGLDLIDGRAAHDRAERRRFAAALAGATEAVVVQCPETELMDGRQRRLSPFILAVLAERRGSAEPPVPVDIPRRGTRARTAPDDPARALDAMERELALAEQDPASGVRGSVARRGRLVALHRRLGAPPHVPPGTLAVPALAGSPISARAAAELIDDPARFLFTRVLGAWGPRALPAAPPAVWGDDLRRRVVGVARACLGDPRPFGDAFAARWAASEAARLAAVEGVDPAEVAAAARVAALLARTLAPPAERLAVPVSGPLGDTAIVVDDGEGVIAHGAWVELVERVDPASTAQQVRGVVVGVAEVEERSFGAPARRAVDADALGLAARQALAEIADGTWRWEKYDRVRLAGEGPDVDDGEDG